MEQRFSLKLLPNGDPPFLPDAEARFRKVKRDDDPNFRCLPYGVPRIILARLPFEIVQLPDRVLIIYEADHWARQVFMDGRQHPTDRNPTFMGHSTGKWDGDTLVIDTVGFNDQTWLDHTGLPHSDALHLVERMRRVSSDVLQVDITVDDPKTYAKPWTAQKMFNSHPDWEILENVCVPYNPAAPQK
jgi:hypothetical protein